MKAGCVIAGSRPWCRHLAEAVQNKTGIPCRLIQAQQELTLELLESLSPRYIFFPHWSWIIPETIWKRFECVIFHMTDLPYGRGGSPLQNLIIRGYQETKISAFRCSEGIDTGPIYLKRPLSLLGTAEEIYIRANAIIQEMIIEILNTYPASTPQYGEVTIFKRRKPEESNLDGVQTLEELFDKIRMLDADGYPPAFWDVGKFRLHLTRASRKTDKLLADVCITLRDERNV
ncbi:methionyl-tRNA formyltransferase [Desulfovibrio sp. PG-178-WT-4]|uniref:Methionyl-tRNA formyltransferase n=1 Tax=Desulfovibrio porci TaxID=2605782 RepID=A0A6L5XKV0_9BACT|nr:formyltransferase family protein [Desulfovibrio porci]MSS27814.1 methionyl-tRNA formyltransferase [Desulfovibrio porci]